MFEDNRDNFDPKDQIEPTEKEDKEIIADSEASDVDDETLDELEEIESGIVPGLKDVEISSEVRSAFLDYAMSVIVARAIPDVRDGFKPVHRRIIFSMNETGMTPDKPHKKSARIVGDVMGKYHPHGDSAIYSTLVRLAQNFSMRYPLVDGHGNFGSIDGDEAAAMRYTEARMSKMALEMVRDIDLNTVDFVDNYDGTEQEPVVLPSRFPNLLVNGTSGIAVGMATNMAPHNLNEVVNAIVAIAHQPDLTPLEIMQNYLSGPDFPTGGFILGRAGIRKAYETGQGSVIMRAKTHVEQMDNGKNRIIVTEIPYQVNKARVIEAIADLVRNKVMEGITDIRDESNSEGIRVVIELRKDIIPEVLLNQLYKNTQLQTSFGIINLCLVNNAPKVLPITDLLKNYLDYQIEI
ncbi:MAG: DNA gyrase subunit A, partial [Bacilli bacterium]